MGSDTDQPVEKRLQGTGVSPGIVRATAYLRTTDFEEPESRTIPRSMVPKEKARFHEALTRTREQIRALQQEIESTLGAEHAGIFDAHLLVLEDSTVLDEVLRLLEMEKRSVDRLYFEVSQRYIESLRRIADPYLRERAIDIEDVASRVLRNLRSPEPNEGPPGIHPGKPSILLTHDLTPSDTATLNRDLILGFATEAGSPTSHSAIVARSLNIPAVVALHDLEDVVHPGDEVLLDGYHGLLIVNPSAETLAQYARFSAEEGIVDADLRSLRDLETVTADGRRIVLAANIEFTSELPQVKEQGAEGIGLYRTEFFYLNAEELRGEDRQAENYGEVAEAVHPHGVIVRTLDIGGDKLWPELFDEPEPNPFLGWRGIRLSLAQPEMFKTQLRAILRASARGKVRIMFPFVSCLNEVREANTLLNEVKHDFDVAGIDYDRGIEVGAMIEIPSAALIADQIAKEVDFFSIGTNDLVQYTLAVDRVNERVAALYQPGHPAVLRLIRDVVSAAHRNGIWVGICGEMAGDVLLTPLLIGAEVDELSVGAAQLLRVRRAVSRLHSDECRTMLDEVLTCALTSDVMARCRTMAQLHYPELLR